MGTPAAWQMGAAARLREEATSPITATTWSWLMQLLDDRRRLFRLALVVLDHGPHRQAADLAALVRASSSCERDLDAHALVDWPNVASLPVSEPYSPITISAFPPPGGAARAQGRRDERQHRERNQHRAKLHGVPPCANRVTAIRPRRIARVRAVRSAGRGRDSDEERDDRAETGSTPASRTGKHQRPGADGRLPPRKSRV